MTSLGRSIAAAIGLAALVTGIGVAFHVGVLGAGTNDAPRANPLLTNPTYVACVNSAQLVCNPEAARTMVAGNPVAQPPSAHSRYISRSRAVAIALALASPGGPPNPEIHARMMTLPQFEALQRSGHDTITNPRRLLWVVTVHAPKDVGSLRPKIVDVYTAVIDAETGVSFEGCGGCDLITSE